MKPLAIDLYCGLGGWTEGLLAEGYDVVGFDNERHIYGDRQYPAQLVLQDVLTLHGSQFRNAALIVASPPCQAYSYRAMPWKRAKALPPPSNELFNACFRVQQEPSEAAGHHIPSVVENVRGAQRWVGRAAWHYGSFYLWGDVPALMPPIRRLRSVSKNCGTPGGTWFGEAHGKQVPKNGSNPTRGGNEYATAGVKLQPEGHYTKPGSGRDWFDMGPAAAGSNTLARKAASAQIAKIPFELASWIARCYRPRGIERAASQEGFASTPVPSGP
jgi:hypothetical protein